MLSLLSIIFFLSSSLTGLVRHSLIKINLLDVPNQRSSHLQSTPSAGGLGAVVSMLVGFVYAQYFTGIQVQSFLPFMILSSFIACVGFVDDMMHVSYKLRLTLQCVCLATGLWGLLLLNAEFTQTAFVGFIVSFICLLWFLNLFNFMDGINGLAGIEAITALVFGAYISFAVLCNEDWLFMLMAAAAALGFLLWNFPIARIFLGDTGSYFFGCLLGFLMIQQGLQDNRLFYVWAILLSVFIVDASITLLRRLLRKENIFAAHNTHAYQCASRRFKSHSVVSLAVLLINTFYLFPIALWVSIGGLDGWLGLCLAYFPLIYLALYFKSGNRASTSSQSDCRV